MKKYFLTIPVSSDEKNKLAFIIAAYYPASDVDDLLRKIIHYTDLESCEACGQIKDCVEEAKQ